MPFTCDEIKLLKNPYQKLGNSDVLAEHLNELNKLSSKEMYQLASAMVLDCPENELDTFGQTINSIKTSSQNEPFYTALYQAYEVKKRILELLDPKNEHPHNLMLGNELNEDLFNEFNDLALNLLNKNESAIAQRLALTTPKEYRSPLSRSIKNTFPKSELATKISAAFAFRREIDLLLGNKPEDFFSSREFNVDLCLEFSSLLDSLIKGQEVSIGNKLRSLDAKIGSDICRKLEMMNPKANDSKSSLRLIASAMSTKEEIAKDPSNETVKYAHNSNTVFNSAQNNKDKAKDEHVEVETSCVQSFMGVVSSFLSKYS